jgi:hypothetical protein
MHTVIALFGDGSGANGDNTDIPTYVKGTSRENTTYITADN